MAKKSKTHRNRYQKIASKLTGEDVPEDKPESNPTFLARGEPGEAPTKEKFYAEGGESAPAGKTEAQGPAPGDKWVGGGNWGFEVLEDGSIEISHQSDANKKITVTRDSTEGKAILAEFQDPRNDFKLGEAHTPDPSLAQTAKSDGGKAFNEQYGEDARKGKESAPPKKEDVAGAEPETQEPTAPEPQSRHAGIAQRTLAAQEAKDALLTSEQPPIEADEQLPVGVAAPPPPTSEQPEASYTAPPTSAPDDRTDWERMNAERVAAQRSVPEAIGDTAESMRQAVTSAGGHTAPPPMGSAGAWQTRYDEKMAGRGGTSEDPGLPPERSRAFQELMALDDQESAQPEPTYEESPVPDRPPEEELQAAAAEGIRRRNLAHPDGMYPPIHQTSEVPPEAVNPFRDRVKDQYSQVVEERLAQAQSVPTL